MNLAAAQRRYRACATSRIAHKHQRGRASSDGMWWVGMKNAANINAARKVYAPRQAARHGIVAEEQGALPLVLRNARERASRILPSAKRASGDVKHRPSNQQTLFAISGVRARHRHRTP